MSSEKIEEEFEWQMRADDIPFTNHMIAGSIAGFVQHTCMFPFDNIKTHTQVTGKDMSFSQIVSHIYNQGGIFHFYSGVQLMLMGCIPAHALYFSIYQFARIQFEINDEELHPFLFGITGAFATFFHDFIMTPIDVIQQRRQISMKSSGRILKQIIHLEGWKSLYRSFPITYLMNTPNAAAIVSVNETFKSTYQKLKGEHTFFSYLGCATLAGGISAIITNPLDIIKTKLQTQDCYCECQKQGWKGIQQQNRDFEQSYGGFAQQIQSLYSLTATSQYSTNLQFQQSPIVYKNVIDTVKKVYKETGIFGFYRGSFARLCSVAPSTGISWTAYETLKHYLNKRTQH